MIHSLWVALSAVAVAAAMALGLVRSLPQHVDAGPHRQIVDGRGKTVILSEPLRRVALFWGGGFGEYLLVARDPARTQATTDPWDEAMEENPLLNRAFPNLHELPINLSIFTQRGANLERLLLDPPTAIITIPWAAALLEPVRLPAVVIPTQGGEPGLFSNTRLLAAVAGQDSRGDDLLAQYASSMTSLHDELLRTPLHDRPHVLMLGVEGPGRFWTVSVPMWDRILDQAGGRPAVSGAGLRHLDVERVVALNPDVIVLRPNGTALAPSAASFMANSFAPALRAARERRVYAWPPGVTQITNNIVEYPLIARWFAELLHPDRLTPRLRNLMITTYGRELHAEPTAGDIDRALYLSGNAGTVNYDRFDAGHS